MLMTTQSACRFCSWLAAGVVEDEVYVVQAGGGGPVAGLFQHARRVVQRHYTLEQGRQFQQEGAIARPDFQHRVPAFQRRIASTWATMSAYCA